MYFAFLLVYINFSNEYQLKENNKGKVHYFNIVIITLLHNESKDNIYKSEMKLNFQTIL